jgi:signal transduction histidine kinase
VAIVAFVPRAAAKAVPFGLVILSLWGVDLVRNYEDGDQTHHLYGVVLAGTGSWWHLVLPEALLFLAVGVWLFLRVSAPGAGNPQAALALVIEAKETSSRALTDLRDLVRGIYPPVLADRGLADAVRALALDTPLPTELDIDLPGPPDGQGRIIEMPVGAAVYFAVAEALANAVRHSGARTVRIHLSYAAGTLRAQVTDDGAGGADPAAGTGLAGVERRLATFDGILAVSSPPGGPTIIAIEVPCGLSSAKISSC